MQGYFYLALECIMIFFLRGRLSDFFTLQLIFKLFCAYFTPQSFEHFFFLVSVVKDLKQSKPRT